MFGYFLSLALWVAAYDYFLLPEYECMTTGPQADLKIQACRDNKESIEQKLLKWQEGKESKGFTFKLPKYECNQQGRRLAGGVSSAAEGQPTVIPAKSHLKYEAKERRFKGESLWKFLGVSGEEKEKISVGSRVWIEKIREKDLKVIKSALYKSECEDSLAIQLEPLDTQRSGSLRSFNG